MTFVPWIRFVDFIGRLDPDTVVIFPIDQIRTRIIFTIHNPDPQFNFKSYLKLKIQKVTLIMVCMKILH